MRASGLLRVTVAVCLVAAAGCSNPLGRQYQYEEQLYLNVNGSATIVIDSSIAALVALRNLPLDPSVRTAVDREQIRRLYSNAGCHDVRVGQPWSRHGRRFVQITIEAPEVSQFASCAPVAWSTFALTREQGSDRETIFYEQEVGAPTVGDPGNVNWDGSELVGFKLHVPSKILHHNVKRLEDGENGEAGRGNILTFEQRLTDRRAGQPIKMEVRMDSQSILYRTLWLFAGAFAAAVLLIMTLVWLTVRRGRQRLAKSGTA